MRHGAAVARSAQGVFVASFDKVSESSANLSAIEVGLQDRQRSGWCDGATGMFVTDVYVKPGMAVVDVGCGNGDYIAFCSDMGADVTFIDVNQPKVEALEKRLQARASGKVQGIVSECRPIPIADGHADLVISTEVLEHVQQPREFLNEIVRIGNADATYVLTVPDARSENLLDGVAHPSYFEEPNHIQRFSAEDFVQLVQECGLQVVRQEYFSAFWSIFYLMKWATSLPGESLTENVHPMTTLWTQTWSDILNHPNGEKMRLAMNNALPRGQVIVARRQGVDQG